MNKPNPAIVSQAAVQRLPRLALLLFCAAYVLPGWVGRDPWKSADMAAFGYMHAMAQGRTGWMQPDMLGLAPEQPGFLPLWMGALAIQSLGGLFAHDFAARIPFALILAGALVFTWYSCYNLARRASAQPVSFAFGGEASPVDFARAIADGALLALIASLGLAQLGHQTTLDVAQLFFASAMLCSLAAVPRKPNSVWGVVVAAPALSACGAPTIALLLCGVGLVSSWPTKHVEAGTAADPAAGAAEPTTPVHAWRLALGGVLFAGVLAAVVGLWLDQFRYTLRLPASWREWRDLARLWLWFAWPGSLLALWTLWRWRGQWQSAHLLLPIGFAACLLCASALTHNSDRAMLLALPALSVLAAFALPTVSRSVAALIDWFTLFFFSGCALVIWVVWLSIHTGVPAQPAANVARLAPGFEPQFGLIGLVFAVWASVAWGALVRWRVGRNRHPIWKSVVLPAGGAALCWVLLMTLWMPLLDFARGYAPLMNKLKAELSQGQCVAVFGFNRAQIAALTWHIKLPIESASRSVRCEHLVIDADAQENAFSSLDSSQWAVVKVLRRPADDDEDLIVYRRLP